MTGRWERGSGTVLTPEVPDICLERRFQEGKYLGREQVHGQDTKPSPGRRLGPISLCLGEIF